MSFGKSSGGGGNQSSESRTFVDPMQQARLQQLFGNAQQTFDQLQQPFAERAGQLGQQFNQAQTTATNNLADISRGARGGNQFLGNLGDLASQSNPFLQQQIQGLGGDIQRQLQQSLGNIGQGFVSAGQFGGSRQGLAEGQAITGALNEFGQQAATLRGDDLTRQAQAAQMGLQGQLQGGIGAQSGLQNAFNLGLSPFTSQLGFLGQLGDIFGPATTLAESSSKGKTKGSTTTTVGLI